MHSKPNSTGVTLWHNAQIATMNLGSTAYGMLDHAAIAVKDGIICWIGNNKEIPQQYLSEQVTTLDCHGQLITPGLVDCHTHLIYGGNRATEFEQRLIGASYADIAKAGGGILSTVSATRAASADELLASATQRLLPFMNEGVTTVEIKSGYGLNLADEMKMLHVGRLLNENLSIDVLTTFLGAHATPPEFKDDNDAYIDYLCTDVLPQVASTGLADAVDGFCEHIAFTPAQIEKVFDVAQQLQLPIKLHAEQLSDLKGAIMASKRGALSVDHIEYLQDNDVATLANNNTTAVLLPGAYYFLNETQLPPIDALRQHGVPIAIASDSNPGSSPVSSLLLMLNMACTLFKLTPEESLAGVTRNAALALGIDDRVGTLKVGMQADMVLWNISNPAELSYRLGGNPASKVMYKGIIR